jgi:hypothetical protein
MQEMPFQRRTFKKFPGRACLQTPVANFCLPDSGGGQGKWALWQFCPTTEESLKMH